MLQKNKSKKVKEHEERPQIISFHCIVKNKLGQVLSTSFNQDVVNQKNIIQDRLPGLVDGLQSVHAGEKRSVLVPAHSAYGSYDPRLVVELRRADLDYSKALKHGTQILRFCEHEGRERLYRVIRLNKDTVIADGNHPLAGHDLVFEVEIVSARLAQDDDLLKQDVQVHQIH